MPPSSDDADAAMNPASDAMLGAAVLDARGRRGSVVSLEGQAPHAQAWIRIGGGPKVLVPVDLMAPLSDGAYRLPFAVDEPAGNEAAGGLTLPVHQEQLHVDKRVVETGSGVRLHKTVSEREQTVDLPLLRDELEIKRFAADTVVEGELPRVRYEGDTLVVPVLEEELVVRKQTRLKEEIRITRHRRTARSPQTVQVRSEQVDVERFDDENG